jgi:hypothetical protein
LTPPNGGVVFLGEGSTIEATFKDSADTRLAMGQQARFVLSGSVSRSQYLFSQAKDLFNRHLEMPCDPQGDDCRRYKSANFNCTNRLSRDTNSLSKIALTHAVFGTKYPNTIVQARTHW